jgi:hypothetical protein
VLLVTEPLVKTFFDNASLGALIGAASAFFLVMLNDRRRERRIAKKLLPATLRRLRVLVSGRKKSALSAQGSVHQQTRIRDVGLHFPTARLERFAERSIEHLSEPQAMALDNLVFWMGESDRLNGACLAILDQIILADRDPTLGPQSSRLQVPAMLGELVMHYGEELLLLKKIDELIICYLEHTLNERGGPAASNLVPSS